MHVVVLFGLARWSGSAKKPLVTDVVWMDGSAGAAPAAATASKIPEPTPEPPVVEEKSPAGRPEPGANQRRARDGNAHAVPPVTPPPRPTPVPTATPKLTPKATPKPTPQSTPKPTPKKSAAKASPTPRSSATPREKKVPDAETKKVSREAHSGRRRRCRVRFLPRQDRSNFWDECQFHWSGDQRGCAIWLVQQHVA